MMVRRALHALAGRLPLHVIFAGGAIDPEAWLPLFERYHVLTAPRWLGGWTVYLHHYLRSDPDRATHDHPWDWAIALPLAGGYIEGRVRGFTVRGPRVLHYERKPLRPYRLRGSDFHRVIVEDGPTSWSLFIHGPWTKPWGFLRTDTPARDDDDRPVPARYWPMDDDGVPSCWWRTAARGRDQERAPA